MKNTEIQFKRCPVRGELYLTDANYCALHGKETAAELQLLDEFLEELRGQSKLGEIIVYDPIKNPQC